MSQREYAEAEPLYQRSLEITEQALGGNHPSVATTLNNMALLYESQGRYEEAEPLLHRAMKIREEKLGNKHPATAHSYWSLAALYQSVEKYETSMGMYEQAIEIFAVSLGMAHPDMLKLIDQYKGLLFSMGREAEANALIEKLQNIYGVENNDEESDG